MRYLACATIALSLGMSASAFADDRACLPLTTYTPPPVGAVFTYAVSHLDETIPVQIVREIESVDGHHVRFLHNFESVDGSRPPSPPRPESFETGIFTRNAGQMPDGTPTRSRTYTSSTLDLLTGLEPGQSAEILSSESSAMNDRPRTITAPFQVTFDGCETLDIAGQDEAVRVYSVTYTARTYVPGRRPQADMAAEKGNVFYLSERYGWPLRIDSATGHIQAISIEMPEPESDTPGTGGD